MVGHCWILLRDLLAKQRETSQRNSVVLVNLSQLNEIMNFSQPNKIRIKTMFCPLTMIEITRVMSNKAHVGIAQLVHQSAIILNLI